MSSSFKHSVSMYSEAVPIKNLSVRGLFMLPKETDPEKIRVVTAIDRDKVYHRANQNPQEKTTESPPDTLVVPVLQFSTIQIVSE